MFPSYVRLVVLTSLTLSGAAGFGCSSSVGGPVTGALDDHCTGVTPIVVSQASCHPVNAGPAPDGGADEEAPVLFNAEGDDDDCKYHLSFTTTGVQVKNGATFKVTATKITDHTPATGAAISIESYMAENALHVLPNGVEPAVETAGGNYSIAPVKFDQAGRWVVRFHLYEDCEDLLPDSPHGHAAFYIDVP